MDGLLGSYFLFVLYIRLYSWALSPSYLPLVFVLAAPLNSMAGLCVQVLSSFCPCLGRAPKFYG